MSHNTLELRLMIIMLKEGYSFASSLDDFQRHLKVKFDEDYTHDKIEDALHRIERVYDDTELDEERVIEIEEDFNY